MQRLHVNIYKTEKKLFRIKWFTNSKDECEDHQRLQFFWDKSKTSPFWSVPK